MDGFACGERGLRSGLEPASANVRRLRLEKGLSQEEFGFVAGIDRTYVSGVERGLRNPTIVLAEKFAQGLGVGVDELLRRPSKGAHD